MDLGTSLAIYAAGLSTLLGAIEVARGLPAIKVVVGAEQDRLKVIVANGGRRPVTIVRVWAVKGQLMRGPESFDKVSLPITLGPGQYFVADFGPPTGFLAGRPKFIARDQLQRWWPRRVRPRMILWKIMARRREAS